MDTRKKVADLLSEILGQPIDSTTELRREDVASWDSLNHMRIVMALEEMFSVQVPLEKFSELVSFSALVQLLEDKA